jgi:hypothetical protein
MEHPIVPSERRHLTFPFPLDKAINGQVAIGQALRVPGAPSTGDTLAKIAALRRMVAIMFIGKNLAKDFGKFAMHINVLRGMFHRRILQEPNRESLDP